MNLSDSEGKNLNRYLNFAFIDSNSKIKILVNTDISIIGFYENIGKISVRLKFFIF